MKTAIVALCIASANAAHVIHRKRNNVEYKSINNEGRRLAGDEEYEPYLGMERDLMSMSMPDMPDMPDMSMSMPSMTEVDTMSTEESSAVSAGSAVSVLAIAGAMLLL